METTQKMSLGYLNFSSTQRPNKGFKLAIHWVSIIKAHQFAEATPYKGMIW